MLRLCDGTWCVPTMDSSATLLHPFTWFEWENWRIYCSFVALVCQCCYQEIEKSLLFGCQLCPSIHCSNTAILAAASWEDAEERAGGANAPQTHPHPPTASLRAEDSQHQETRRKQ